MILNRKDYIYYLECDRVALGRNRCKPALFRDPIWRFERLMRRLELAQNRRGGVVDRVCILFLRIKYYRMQMRLGFTIPLNSFGAGLAIVHRGSIVISEHAQIGDNCRIHVGVNIGANAGEAKAATIGNNVYIGPGVKIVGAVHIADDIVIGANAVVVKDVDTPGITIGGIPAKKISDNDSGRHLVRATETVSKSASKSFPKGTNGH